MDGSGEIPSKNVDDEQKNKEETHFQRTEVIGNQTIGKGRGEERVQNL